MLGESYGTVSDIEIMWVLITSLSLFFSLFNTWESIMDYRYFKTLDVPPNGRKDQVEGAIVSEISRTVILLIFLSIGILAMLIPDPPPHYDATALERATSIVFRWGLITGALLISAQTFNSLRIRRRSVLRASTRRKVEQEWQRDK